MAEFRAASWHGEYRQQLQKSDNEAVNGSSASVFERLKLKKLDGGFASFISSSKNW